MTERFVDTSGWGAWADRREQFHAQAVAAMEAVWQGQKQVVTTNWVLAELTALLTGPMRISKPRQIALLDAIRSDPGVLVIPVDASVESAAWQLWRGRPDKDWTAVDCASFAVMQQRGLTEAVSTDRHFEQAGFVRLLK